MRLDVHHVGEAANFLFRERITRRLAEIHVACVHFLGVLEIAFQVELWHGVFVLSPKVRAMQLNTESPREWMMWLRENQQIGLLRSSMGEWRSLWVLAGARLRFR